MAETTAKPAGGIGGTGGSAKGGRMTSSKKADAVLRLLKGEEAGKLAGENSVSVSELQRWRDAFIEAGRQGLKGSGNGGGSSPELKRAQKKIAALTAQLGSVLVERELKKGKG